MTDKELLELCQKFGSNAKKWSRKFAALLPEVNRRGLWKRKFHSIHEFAAQVGGVSPGVVDKVLNLDKKLEEKPLLKAEIAEEGWVKVEVASRIQVKEEEAVKMVKTLPKKTLETFAREVDESEECPKASPGGEWPKLNFTVRPEVELRLRRFQQKLQKKKKQMLSLGETLEELLNLAEEPGKLTSGIPAKQERELRKKHNNKCAIPTCRHPIEEFHHTKRFAKTGTHEHVVPLCHEHHQIAHAGLIENENDPPEKWRFRKKMQPDSIDRKFLKHIQMADGP